MKRYAALLLLLGLVPLAAFGPVERTTPTRWALIIGVGDYMNFGDEPGGDLPGAEFDAKNFRDVLVAKHGFPPENVKMLTNHDATRAAIEDAFTGWLPENARPGDLIFVTFSGHGSQMWDESGDENDGLDETLAPADVESLNTDHDISDDEMDEWLRGLPSDNVVAFLDACHSGTGTRAATPFARARRLEREMSDVPKPPTVSRRALAGQDDETGFDPEGRGVLELAAAQPDQEAMEVVFEGSEGGESFPGGAFTTYFIRELWKTGPETSYEEIHRRAREAMKRDRFQQDPLLQGADPSRPVFWVEGLETATTSNDVPVLSASDETVELAGGELLSVTEGSVYRIGDDATAVVETVSPTRATARIVSGSAPGGSDVRARLVRYRYPDVPLKVNVAGVGTEIRDGVESRLGDVEGLATVADAEAFSHLLLRRDADSVRILGLDGFTRHAVPAGPGAPEALAAALRKEAAAKELADLENPIRPFEVDVTIADGRTTLGIGDEVSFHVTSSEPGYLTLVDLGTAGDVTVLFPNPTVPDRKVAAGETVDFPTAGMRREGLIIAAEPPAGRGMVRAIVTPRPLGLELTEEGLLAGDALLAEEIARALKTSVRGAADDGPGEGAVPLEGWSTASVNYEIRR